MSLKHIVVSVLFVFISIYVAFLNPHESIFYLTQNRSFKLPTVTLLLASAFTGVLVSVVIFWTFNLKNAFSRWKSDLQKGWSEKKQKQLEDQLKKGKNLFLAGELDKSLSVVDKILDAFPENVEALDLKGKILCARGELEQAANFQKQALARDPQSMSVLFDLAKTYAEAGQHNEEINLLKKTHRENPKAVRPLLHLREAYLKEEDWQNVCSIQNKILPLIRENKKQWDEEIENKSRFLYSLGKQKWKEGKHDLAISNFKQALKTWDKNSEAHLFLGDAYLEKGKTKAALKKWFNGFQQTHSIACLIRAQKVYRNTGEPQELIQIYQKEIDPNHLQESSIYILLLAILYLEHGQADKAKVILEENQGDHALLNSLLLIHATPPANNGSNGANSESSFDLIREAVFQLAH